MILKAKDNSDLFPDNSGLDDKFYYLWGLAVSKAGANLSGFSVPTALEELTTEQANTYFISKDYTPTNFF